MSNLHPHWQADEIQQHVHTETEISRRPAAIVGMLIVLGIFGYVIRGADMLKGQVSDATFPTIMITEHGFVPSYIEVEKGQTIQWESDTDALVTLLSDTLCSDNAFCLRSDALQKGQKHTFSITQNMQARTYTYTSKEGQYQGQITVLPSGDEFVDLTNIIGQDLYGSAPEEPTPTNPFGSNAAPASDPTPQPLPTNPHTTTATSPPPPSPPVPSTAPLYTQTRGPVRQPQTGAEVWIVIAGSILGLWYSTRGMFAQAS